MTTHFNNENMKLFMSSEYEIFKDISEFFIISKSIWCFIFKTSFIWYVFCIDDVSETYCFCCSWLLLLLYHESICWSVNCSCWDWLLLLSYHESTHEPVNDDLLKLLMLFSVLKYSFWIQFQDYLSVDRTSTFEAWDEKSHISDWHHKNLFCT